MSGGAVRSYYRSETGWVMLGTMGAALLVSTAVALAAFAAARALYAFAFPPLFLLVILNFYRLAVSADAGGVTARLGVGLISRTVRLGDIASAEVVREPWYGGWGLRWTGNGWFWTVGSLDAVALNLKDGREFLIGTDDPQALLAAVNARLAVRHD